MAHSPLEYAQIKQPNTIELYIEKLAEMNNRTVIQYDSRWTSLLQRENDQFLADKISSVVKKAMADAVALKIKPSTYRAYKAAICYGLATTYLQIENENIADEELENGLNVQLLSGLYKDIVAKKIEYAPLDQYEQRTSAKKRKSFPKEFYDYLNGLETSPVIEHTPRFRLMLSFVYANLVVGLRPIEWLNVRICTSLKNKCMVLLVENAKNSNGRANGPVRELSLIDASKDQERKVLSFYILFQDKLAKFVDRFLEAQKKYEAKSEYSLKKDKHVFGYIFEDYKPSVIGDMPAKDICNDQKIPQNGLAEIVLRSLQNEMYRHFNRFLKSGSDTEKSRVTLYSTRHQCIANAKASRVNIFEIAAFFGHSSKETSSRHYGKAWAGWSNFTFRPHPESILAVSGAAKYVAEHYPEFITPNQSITLGDDDLYLRV